MPENAGLSCLLIDISMENTVIMKTSNNNKKNKSRNGLVKILCIDKLTGKKWVN